MVGRLLSRRKDEVGGDEEREGDREGEQRQRMTTGAEHVHRRGGRAPSASAAAAAGQQLSVCRACERTLSFGLADGERPRGRAGKTPSGGRRTARDIARGQAPWRRVEAEGRPRRAKAHAEEAARARDRGASTGADPRAVGRGGSRRSRATTAQCTRAAANGPAATSERREAGAPAARGGDPARDARRRQRRCSRSAAATKQRYVLPAAVRSAAAHAQPFTPAEVTPATK